MNYQEAVDYIQGAAGQGSKVGLRNMELLLSRLGDPHKRQPCAHIAGTNGKGSICAMLDSVLRECGHRVGMYTSPYLERYNERIRVNGAPVADEELALATSRVAVEVEALRGEGVRPTFFEIGTAVAFECFRRAGITFAVVEVGLGGRLDPTNVVMPEVCVIGSIGMDHMKLLGDTLPLIAAEKGGIIKPYTPVALYPQPGEVFDMLSGIAKSRNAPVWRAADAVVSGVASSPEGNTFDYRLGEFVLKNVHVRLAGGHQINNAATAITALLALRERGYDIPNESILSGLANARWPGRLELFPGKPPILLDGAHNEPAARALREAVETLFAGKRIVVVTGIMTDKDYRAVAGHIAAFAQEAICVEPDSHRALPASDLAEIYRLLGVPAQTASCIPAVLSIARSLAGADGLVAVTGSLYVAGAARRLLAAEQ